ncbi:SH3 domain-containing protein [Sphingomonas sp.]|jgi:uncharacterized protein YgiM (DUF1202 family)|uniref:SH3 domain-containing protein n=1 Tax=Sphingomonas sp. TaxID=28214 RepID=UPI002ED7F4EA
MARIISQAVDLRAKPTADSEVLAELKAGDGFEVLDLAGANAWGVAPAAGLVGYIHADALSAPSQ